MCEFCHVSLIFSLNNFMLVCLCVSGFLIQLETNWLFSSVFTYYQFNQTKCAVHLVPRTFTKTSCRPPLSAFSISSCGLSRQDHANPNIAHIDMYVYIVYYIL